MLRIGHLTFDSPFVQAALSGYSDTAMRLMARRMGAPYTLHEVVLDRLVIEKGRLQKRILDVSPDEHPVGGQLMGSEPEQFSAAAARMAESGFDVVDINFGCPVKKVLGRKRGGYLLSDPETAIEIVRRVRDAVDSDVPVTVKMRRGLDDTAESEDNFFRIFDAAFDYGIAAITVHGRTVEQRYVGPSRWSFLARVKKHAGERVVLGSGDLFTADDCVRMLRETGVDGVTIARGCIGNPWIFDEARALLRGDPLPDPPTVAEQGRVIRAHFMLSEQFNGAAAGKVMRKFGIKYAELHPEYASVRAAFIACQTSAQWLDVLNDWYDPQREWAPGQRKVGPGDLIAAGACA